MGLTLFLTQMLLRVSQTQILKLFLFII
jgi:hypothetical protein